MPDHVHMFVRPGKSHALSETIKHLKQSITKSFAYRHRPQFVWERGFFDRLLRTSETYSERWNYVRMNPVRAGLVHDPDDWPYQGEIVYIDRV